MIESRAAFLFMTSQTRAASGGPPTFNSERPGPGELRGVLDYGGKRMKFAPELRGTQRNNGLRVLCEDPAGASSWAASTTQRMFRREDAQTRDGDLRCDDLSQIA
eukprot:6689802-Pyramimonas_sp.AAC.2